MELNFAFALLGAFFISVITLISLSLLLLSSQQLNRILPTLICLAIGVLLGNAFLHLIPESIQDVHRVQPVMYWVLGGVVFFLILDKGLMLSKVNTGKVGLSIKPIGFLNLLGDGIHNFVDGLIIGGSFMLGPEVGTTTTVAIAMHELPQELGDAGTLIYSGMKPVRVVLLNFLVGLMAILGVVVFFFINEYYQLSTSFLFAFTAGGFIYMAIGNLLPSLMNDKTINRGDFYLRMIFIGLGVLIVYSLNGDHSHEPHHHPKAQRMGIIVP